MSFFDENEPANPDAAPQDDRSLYERFFDDDSASSEADAFASEIGRNFHSAQKTLQTIRFGHEMGQGAADSPDRLISLSEFAALQDRVAQLEARLKDAQTRIRRLEENPRAATGSTPAPASVPASTRPAADASATRVAPSAAPTDEPEFRIEATCRLGDLNRLLQFLRDLYPNEERAVKATPVWHDGEN